MLGEASLRRPSLFPVLDLRDLPNISRLLPLSKPQEETDQGDQQPFPSTSLLDNVLSSVIGRPAHYRMQVGCQSHPARTAEAILWRLAVHRRGRQLGTCYSSNQGPLFWSLSLPSPPYDSSGQFMWSHTHTHGKSLLRIYVPLYSTTDSISGMVRPLGIFVPPTSERNHRVRVQRPFLSCTGTRYYKILRFKCMKQACLPKLPDSPPPNLHL